MTEHAVPGRSILIVDDEPMAIAGLQMMLESEGMDNIVTLSDSREVLPVMKTSDIGVVLLDLCMPHMDGETLLGEVGRRYPDVSIIVVTGYNEVETAISCMKAGAFDYLVKPVDDARLISAVRRAVEMGELKSEYAAFKRRVLGNEIEHPEHFAHMVTGSRKMFNLFQYVETIAPTVRPVLVQGETGTGKELLARAIHMASGTKGPFVTVNLAGLEEHMFSDTLFGHLKGAFTGADHVRSGLVERAHKGTLFLDEIGELDPASQVKLLRLLQENEYYPLGADAPRIASCRIVAATNVDLNVAQQQGRFRSDLYFRLKTHQIEIPPLRDRREDIPLLLGRFLESAARTLGKAVPVPPRELTQVLKGYYFPGNVRELESMVFDAVTHHKSKILSMEGFLSHMNSQKGTTEERAIRLSEVPGDSVFSCFANLPSLSEARDMLIEDALRRANGNYTVAAQILGISRSGLSKALLRKGQQHRS